MTPHEKRPIPEASPFACLAFLPRVVRIAREHGYALAVHGSLARDFDFVAIPWVDEAVKPEELVEAIRAAVGGFFDEHDHPASKPHGRRAWVIHLGGGPYIDLSVMPPKGTMFTEKEVEALLSIERKKVP